MSIHSEAHERCKKGAKHVRRGKGRGDGEAETTVRLEVVAWGHECSAGRSSSYVVVTDRGSIPADYLYASNIISQNRVVFETRRAPIRGRRFVPWPMGVEAGDVMRCTSRQARP